MFGEFCNYLYYQDDVERVQNVIEKEFSILETERSHQAVEYSPDQFGYLSLHLLVTLSLSRSSLPEWNDYSDLHAEIQIRTVLQHSWAAISHAMQYKREADVPSILRRKLFRLAGIFELADEQFIALRDARSDFKESVRTAFRKDEEANLAIDSDSLLEFIRTWSKMPKIINTMKGLGYEYLEDADDVEDDDLDSLGPISRLCQDLGIETISELQKTLNFDPKSYLKWIKGEGSWMVTPGFTVYLLLIRARIQDISLESLLSQGWTKSVAKRVLDGAIKDASNEK